MRGPTKACFPTVLCAAPWGQLPPLGKDEESIWPPHFRGATCTGEELGQPNTQSPFASKTRFVLEKSLKRQQKIYPCHLVSCWLLANLACGSVFQPALAALGISGPERAPKTLFSKILEAWDTIFAFLSTDPSAELGKGPVTHLPGLLSSRQ